MKIIATSDELKDLRNLFIQGFTSLDDKDRTELEDKIKDLENTIDYKNTFIDSLNDDKSIMLKTQVDLNNTNKNLKNQLNLQYKKESDINKELEILKADYASLKTDNQELKKANQAYLSYQFKLEEKIKSIQDKTPWALEKENQELKTKLEQAEKSSYIQGTTKDIFTMPKDNSIKEMFTGVATPGGEMYYKYKLDNNDLSSENSIGTIYGNPLNLELQRECIQLKEKNKELVAEYESLEQKKINLEVENENLNSELNDIKQVLKQSNVKLKDELNFKNEVISLQSNLIEAKQLLEDSLSTIESLEATIGFLEADKTRLKEANNKMFQSNEKLSKEIESLNLENSKVYHRNKELEEASKKFIDLNTKLNFDVKNLSEYKTIKDKEFDNLSKSFDELWNDRDELRKAGSRMKKELEIAYSLAELRLKEINGLINNKVEIIRVLDKYAGDTQPGTKYININVLKDIKQYL